MAGICPCHNETGGKRRSGRTCKGGPWLRSAVLEAAHAAAHVKDIYLSDQYHRLAGRKGKKKALVASQTPASLLRSGRAHFHSR